MTSATHNCVGVSKHTQSCCLLKQAIAIIYWYFWFCMFPTYNWGNFGIKGSAIWSDMGPICIAFFKELRTFLWQEHTTIDASTFHQV